MLCYAERGYATVKVVCLSVCPSVTLRYRYADHIGWNTSKIISQLIRVCALGSPNTGDLVQREHPQNFCGIGVGSFIFSAENLQYLLNETKSGIFFYVRPGLLYLPIMVYFSIFIKNYFKGRGDRRKTP